MSAGHKYPIVPHRSSISHLLNHSTTPTAPLQALPRTGASGCQWPSSWQSGRGVSRANPSSALVCQRRAAIRSARSPGFEASQYDIASVTPTSGHLRALRIGFSGIVGHASTILFVPSMLVMAVRVLANALAVFLPASTADVRRWMQR